jgi:hypothetical protein
VPPPLEMPKQLHTFTANDEWTFAPMMDTAFIV